MIFISAIPKPSVAPKATEIKSSANKEGENLIEYTYSDLAEKIDIADIPLTIVVRARRDTHKLIIYMYIFNRILKYLAFFDVLYLDLRDSAANAVLSFEEK